LSVSSRKDKNITERRVVWKVLKNTLGKKDLNSIEGKNVHFYNTRIINQKYILLKCSEHGESRLPEMLQMKLVPLGVHCREQLMLADERSP